MSASPPSASNGATVETGTATTGAQPKCSSAAPRARRWFTADRFPLLAASVLTGVIAGAPADAAGNAGPASGPPPGVAPPSASQVTPRDLAPQQTGRPPSLLTIEGGPVAPPGSDKAHFVPGAISVDGGLASFAAEERRLTKVEPNQPITVARLYAIAGRVEAAYLKRGYVFVRVIVPPQTLSEGGVAHLQIVSGFIETVDLAKTADRLRGPIGAILKPLVNRRWIKLPALERRLSLAGDVAGAKVRSAIERGETPGGVKLIIEAQSEPISGSLSWDNKLGASLGPQEMSIQLAGNSLYGYGEQIYGFVSGDPTQNVRMLNGRATRRAMGGGLIIPLNADGLKLNLEQTVSYTQPRGGFFRTFDVFNRWSVRLSDPLIRDRTQTLLLTASADVLKEQNAATDFGVYLSDDHYRIERLGLAWTLYLPRSALNVSATASIGQGDAPVIAPLSRGAARTRFSKLEATASYQRALPWGLQAQAILRGQAVVDGGVPNAEVFSLDGPSALSAFQTGELVADHGVTARVSLGRTWTFAAGAVALTPSVYGAGARAFFAEPTPFDIHRAAAVGMSLDLLLRPPGREHPISAVFDWGDAVIDGPQPNHTRVGITLGYAF